MIKTVGKWWARLFKTGKRTAEVIIWKFIYQHPNIQQCSFLFPRKFIVQNTSSNPAMWITIPWTTYWKHMKTNIVVVVLWFIKDKCLQWQIILQNMFINFEVIPLIRKQTKIRIFICKISHVIKGCLISVKLYFSFCCKIELQPSHMRWMN